jgi:hypothetical protein
MKFTIKTLRKLKKQLTSRQIQPNKDGNYSGVTEPRLENGTIYFGLLSMMHPSSYLDTFGEESFRNIKSDVSIEIMEKHIKTWESKKRIENGGV